MPDEETAVVVYDHPLDSEEPVLARQNGVEDLAHSFFTRCLEAGVVAYVVTKKTVLKGQKGFGQKMKEVFDADSEPTRPARKGDGPGLLDERRGGGHLCAP